MKTQIFGLYNCFYTKAFYIYNSSDYIAAFYSTEEMTCKLVKANNLILDIQFQG
jgi:hypothetical protein